MELQEFKKKIVTQLSGIGVYQCALCADFSLHITKPGGCPICKEGNPFMELVGAIKFEKDWISKDCLCFNS